MTLVKTEIINIEWENDEDGDIAYEHGTGRSLILQLPDYELTAKEIDDEIRDAIETETGHRPLHWHVFEFDADALNEEDEEDEEDEVLNLYMIKLEKNIGYDMYDSAVVIATSFEEARNTHPDGSHRWDKEAGNWGTTCTGVIDSWGPPEKVSVEFIGTALSGKTRSVVVSSFNAG